MHGTINIKNTFIVCLNSYQLNEPTGSNQQ